MKLKTVHITLANGKDILSVSRFHTRNALKDLGFVAGLPNSVWEACSRHNATVHWAGMVLRSINNPTYTKELSEYTIVDPVISGICTGGYSVGEAHPSLEVAPSFEDAVRAAEEE